MGIKVTVGQKYVSYRTQRERELVNKLDSNMAKATAIVERQAKEDCPVDTGRLRSSITGKQEREGDKIIGIVGTNVEYAPHVEYGTAKTPAQPFLFPALEKKKNEIMELLKSA